MKYMVINSVVVLLISGTITTGAAGEPSDKREPAPRVGASEAQDRAVDGAKPQSTPLEKLGWLVGQWVDQGSEARITTSVRWTMDHKFLRRSFVVRADGKIVLEGVQMIGWDPIAKRIHSWTFDSEGGFGQAYWIQDGKRWLAKKTYVLATGEKASAVNIVTYVDRNTLRWQSTSREVGGQLMPNVPEVTIVRKDAKHQPTPKAGDRETSK